MSSIREVWPDSGAIHLLDLPISSLGTRANRELVAVRHCESNIVDSVVR
jgi:hypothetical protein